MTSPTSFIRPWQVGQASTSTARVRVKSSFSVRVADGKRVTRTFTNREYLDELPARKEEVRERIWDPEVRIRGRIASVWAPYDFWEDGAFSHCGVDTFDLVETPESWKGSDREFSPKANT